MPYSPLNLAYVNQNICITQNNWRVSPSPANPSLWQQLWPVLRKRIKFIMLTSCKQQQQLNTHTHAHTECCCCCYGNRANFAQLKVFIIYNAAKKTEPLPVARPHEHYSSLNKKQQHKKKEEIMILLWRTLTQQLAGQQQQQQQTMAMGGQANDKANNK